MVRSEREHAGIEARRQRELDRRPEIVLAVLHGSFERGTVFRDIDVAVWLDPARVAPDARFRYAAFLDELRERTWDDYLDFQPFARQYLRETAR